MKALVSKLLVFVACASSTLAEPPSAVATGPAATPSVIPPESCVLALRRARVRAMRGDQDGYIEKIQTATRECPNPLDAMFLRWALQVKHPLSEEEARDLRIHLVALLDDPEVALPAGMLPWLLHHPDADTREIEMVLHAVERRLAEGGLDATMLESVGVLQERLGKFEDARVTFGRLIEIDPDPRLRFHCAELDMRLEKWDSAAVVLEELLEDDDFPFTRVFYIQALGKTGRYDDVIAQFDLLSADTKISKWAMSSVLVELLVRVAWDFRDLGRDEEAQKLFRRVLAEVPQHEEARAAIAYLYACHRDLGNGEAAQRELGLYNESRNDAQN